MNSSWRVGRQILIFTIYFLVISLPFVIFAYYMLSKQETCFDTILNQDETGVDCGGVCSMQCKGSYSNLKVVFSRAMPVSPGKFNFFALLENYNQDIEFPKVPYTVKLFNDESQLLVSATGTTKSYPNSRSAIFLPSLQMQQIPKIVDLNIGNYEAIKSSENNIQKNVRSGAWVAQRASNNSLQVVVKIKNNDVTSVSDFDVYALLYDTTKTVYAVGKSYVSTLDGRGETAAVFTWGNLPDPANADFIIVPKF